MRAVALVAALALVTLGVADVGVRGEGPGALWSTELRLTGGGMEDRVEVGFQDGASASFDAGLDRPEPPPPPGASWVRIFARGDDPLFDLQRLDRSVTNVSPLFAWDVRLEAGLDTDDGVLSWSALPLASHAVELVLDGEVVDLRAPGSRNVSFAEGPVSARVEVYALDGAPPSAPRALLASPSELSRGIRLSWLPPEADGGLPLRGYHVHEVWPRPHRIATLGLVTEYVDAPREIGEAVVYHVEAFNALSSSKPSNIALAVGAARERTLQPTSAPSERELILRGELSTRPLANAAPHVGLSGAPNASDARTYDLTLEAAGQQRTAGVFTAGVLDSTFALDLRSLLQALGVEVDANVARGGADLAIFSLHATGAIGAHEDVAVQGPQIVESPGSP